MSTQLLVQDVAPWYVGQTAPAWTITVLSGGQPGDYSTATSATMLLALDGADAVPAVGPVTLTDPAEGVFTWAPAAADVAAPGIFRAYLQIETPAGNVISDPVSWPVVALN